MYEMKDEFKTNIQFIDEQHEKLFEIADNAYMLLTDNFTLDKYDKIMDIIDELKDYTKFHFDAEEKYMESINYKKLFSQKVSHEAFIKKLNEFNLKDIDENQDATIRELLKFLNDWLIEHILHSDKLIAEA